MTLGEFKAWLEGLEEGSAGKVPTKDQWKRIKQKMGEVREPVTAPVLPAPIIIDRGWPRQYEVTRPTWIVSEPDTVGRWPQITCNNTSSTFTIDGGESMAEVS